MKHCYILFHKPYGALSQFSDPDGTGHGTLGDFVRVAGVYPVGRLDHDSEGLMLVTSDGALQHQLTDPKFEHPRTYWVQVEGTPVAQALRQLESGVEIRGYRTRPARARLLPAKSLLPPRDRPSVIAKKFRPPGSS